MSDVSESPDSADHAGPAPSEDDAAGPKERLTTQADDGDSDGDWATVEFDKIEGEASTPVAWLAPQQGGHGRMLRTGKILVAAVAALVFLVTGGAWGTTTWLDGRMHAVTALDPHSTSITDAPAQYGDENVLVVGSDTRMGAQQGDGIGDPTTVTGARSDTVMIAHIAADRTRAVIVSFPRDLQIQRPACEVWDPTTRTYTGRTDPGAPVAKLNSAYEIGGPLCVTKVVQQLSGLAVTRFVGIDFQGFKALVDALGGVAVCVEHPLKDSELGTIIPQPGTHKITGDTALNYVRARHVSGDPTSDYGRIGRQQRFLSSVLRQLLSPGVLLNPGRLGSVVDAIAANTIGENIGSRELLDLGQSMEGLDPADVLFVTVPTTGEANANGNEVLRMRDSAALFRAVIDGSPLPGEHRPGEHEPDARTHAAGQRGDAPQVSAQAGDPRATDRLVGPATLTTSPHAGPDGEATRPAGTTVPTEATEASATESTGASTGQPDTIAAPVLPVEADTPASGGATPSSAGPAPTPGSTSPAEPSSAPAPSQVRVRVLNGSGVAGSAGEASQDLRDAGFEVADVGDAPVKVPSTVIRYAPAQEAEALTLLAVIPDAVLQPDQTLTDSLVLVVGPDFHGVTPSAAPTGPNPQGPGPLETVNGADTTCS